jgi:hypothetical protein
MSISIHALNVSAPKFMKQKLLGIKDLGPKTIIVNEFSIPLSSIGHTDYKEKKKGKKSPE